MKRINKALSVFLAALMLTLSIAPAAYAAQSYPEGITKEQTLSAISKTDTAIDSFLINTQNKSLKELVLPEFYSDTVLSSLTSGIYSMIEENAESISSAGIKVTVSDVAECLDDYPDVKNKLSSFNKWSEVNLDGVKWGVNGKEDFVKAVGCIFSPFNDLLYMLLCNGSYSLNPVIGIKGDYGYENAVVPALKALGCEEITVSTEFYEAAEENKNSMVENIISDVISLFEGILDTPCDKLTDILPAVAYFFNNGGFDDAVSKLIEPLRLQIFNIVTFIKIEFILSFIQNSESYTQNFTLNFNDILGSTGLKMAEIDLEELASCGTASGNTVVADKADTFIVLLRWIIDTAKLNKDSIGEMSGNEMPYETTDVINSVMSISTDELIKSIISLLTQEKAKVLEYSWTFAEYTPVAVTYTPNLGAEKYQRVVDGIDELINEFILEGGKYKNTREVLEPQIYSNAVVTELVKGIYGIFESEEIKMFCDLLDLNITTYSVANNLKGNSYSSARYTLYRNSKWSDISIINWGFKDGNKNEFVNAVCKALSPLEPILTMLLAEGKITVLDSIDIYGSNGYNTAVIPILEALGCSADSIKTYDEFKKYAQKGESVKTVAEAVVSLIERVLDKPAYTIIEILPNLLWFMESGGLETALNNLLYPLASMLKELGMESIVDMSAVTGEMNTDEILSVMLGDMDSSIDLENLNIEQFASMGQLTTMQSKRTLNGQPVHVSYIKADAPAIAVTLLRFIAEMMKSPDGGDMMLGLMGNKDDSMITQFSGGIGEEMQKMTVDETVEWLYKLFFRERPIIEEKVTEKFLPTVIYEPEEKEAKTPIVILSALIIAAAVILVIKKKKKANLSDEDDFETENKKDFQEV